MWGTTQPQAENDYWLLSRIGQSIWIHQSIPSTLLFPYTEARDFHYNAHEWLPALLFFAFNRLFDQATLGFLLGILGVVLFTALSYTAYRRSGGSLSLSLGLGLLAMLGQNYRHFLRPELFTLFFLLAYLISLEQLTKKLSTLNISWSIGLIALWANTHGSFVLTLPLALIYTADRMQHYGKYEAFSQSIPNRLCLYKAFWLSLPILVFIASLCTPFGTELWKFSLGFSHDSLAKKEIVEWMSLLDIRSYSVVGIYPSLAFYVINLTIVIVYRRKLPLRVIGTSMLFLALAAWGNRFLVYQGIILCWVASLLFSADTNTGNWKLESKRLLTLFIATATGLLFCYKFGNMNAATPFNARSNVLFSHGISAALQDQTMRGNVFNSYDLGGELIYRGYPRLKPSIDSRIDSYGDQYYFWHESLLDEPYKFQSFISRWNVQYLLLTRPDFDRWQKMPPTAKNLCNLIATDHLIFLHQCIGPARPQ